VVPVATVVCGNPLPEVPVDTATVVPVSDGAVVGEAGRKAVVESEAPVEVLAPGLPHPAMVSAIAVSAESASAQTQWRRRRLVIEVVSGRLFSLLLDAIPRAFA
jgi:hypothetical protein